MRRVVVTGMGIVYSIGNNVDDVKKSLFECKPGITKAVDYGSYGFKSQVYGNPTIELEKYIDRRKLRFLADGSAWAYISAEQAIADAGQHPMTQIWFENPRRCAQTLKLFAEIQGNRKIAISRELTKLYEQVERGTLAELASHYAEQEPPKGEMVLVIEGCATDKKMDEDEILSLLTEKLNQLSLRDAVREVEGLSGRRHKEIYQLALQIRQEKS